MHDGRPDVSRPDGKRAARLIEGMRTFWARPHRAGGPRCRVVSCHAALGVEYRLLQREMTPRVHGRRYFVSTERLTRFELHGARRS